MGKCGFYLKAMLLFVLIFGTKAGVMTIMTFCGKFLLWILVVTLALKIMGLR